MAVEIRQLKDKATGTEFVPVTTWEAVGNKPSIPDVTSKADKVSSATSGNFAGLDSNGNLTDSGSKASDFATAAQGAKADSALLSIPTASANILGGIKVGNNMSIDNSGVLSADIDTSIIEVADSVASLAMSPNTLYIFQNRTNALTLTLGTAISGKVSEYHCIIECGSTAPTITWPSGLSWNGGNAPTIEASKKYEISILNSIATYIEV